jgi:hypothetical protein
MRLLKLLLVATLMGCSSSPTGADGVNVEVVFDSTLLVAGKTQSFKILVSNVGNARVLVRSLPCEAAFDVLDVGGRIVGPFRGGACTLAAPEPVWLEPSRQLSFEHHWDGSALGTGFPAKYLPAGSYFIRARVMLNDAPTTSPIVGLNVR